MENIELLPNCYKKTIHEVKKMAISIFNNNLISMTLGGSAGKNDVILGWSDIDLYIVLKNYDTMSIKKYSKLINKFDIHIGITYYTKIEILNKMIDNKTKIMIYEKQKLKMNPTIYGVDMFHKVYYKEIVDNDKRNLPNVLHKFRRMHNNVICGLENINKNYIKNLLLLLKCYLNTRHVFSYGYAKTVDNFLKIYNLEKGSTKKI